MLDRNKVNQEGMALVMVVFAVIVILGALTAVVLQTHSARTRAQAAVRSVQIDQACRAGIDAGIEQIWNQYVVGNGNTTGNLASYRVFINAIVPNSEDLNGNGIQDPNEPDLNGNGLFDQGNPTPVELVPANDPVDLGAGGSQVAQVTVTRRDDITGTTLTLRSTGQIDQEQRAVTQTIRVSGQPFDGFDFAVLAKNITCILCHADFEALDLAYNGDPDNYNTFDRIKIASIEELHLRTGQANSKYAGTLYTRGAIRQELSGNPVSDGDMFNSTVRAYEFDGANGIIQQDINGNMTQSRVQAAAFNPDGEPDMFANFYRGYPTDNALMTDGPVPTEFPAPFPDENEDRYVDDSEFQIIANSADGNISGGVVYGLAPGEFYADSSLPASANGALATLSSNSSYDGNLILVGTDQNPIQINGTVAVNGDVVMKGKIKGWGQLMVRGNAYVVGDTTYADAPGDFGLASDGTENGFALMSGGSIVMGDYLTINTKRHSRDNSDWNSYAPRIDVRAEHRNATVTYSRQPNETVNIGYFDPGAVDPGEYSTTMLDANGQTVPRQGRDVSFSTAEMMTFNNMELDRMLADPNYVPRFYGLRESQPDNVYVYQVPNRMHPNVYNDEERLAEYLQRAGVPQSRLSDAAIHYLSPTAGWMSEDALRQIWHNDEMSRPSSGRPMQFDGLLYTNNSIFTITRARMYGNTGVGHGSYTDGKLRIRGAIIAPDLGILAPSNFRNVSDRGLMLLYDRRVNRFWSPEDTTQVAFQRLAYTLN